MDFLKELLELIIKHTNKRPSILVAFVLRVAYRAIKRAITKNPLKAIDQVTEIIINLLPAINEAIKEIQDFFT